MKLTGITILLVALAIASQVEARKSYKGYKTYKVTPKTAGQLQFLASLKNNTAYDFWSQPRLVHRDVVVMVPPRNQRMFESMLKFRDIKYSVLINDVESIVERDAAHMRNSKFSGKISFDRFYRYDDIVEYVNQLAEENPDLVKVSVIGQTYEGRDIVGLTISSGGNGQRPAVFIEAGIHAREWIAPSVALYLLNQLVENYDSNRDLVDNLDFFIVPVTNPDGYEYTHTNDRFWRKNRFRTNALCAGIDCNRNFGFHFGESGTSNNACSETYLGKAPFSEKESSAIRDFGSLNKGRIHLYIALHSYGPYILYPWGYDAILTDDWEDLDFWAYAVAQQINFAGGPEYDVGNSAYLLYPAAGASDDWFKGENGAKYAYTIELPGGGSGGFDPPPSSIDPTVKQTWAGIKEGLNRIVAEFGKKK